MRRRVEALLYGTRPAVESLEVQAQVAGVVAPVRQPFRTLVTHLFACLFANDTSSASTTPTTLMLQTAIALGLPPFLYSLALFPSYNGTMPWMHFRSFAEQAGDHFVLVTYSAVVLGAAALLKWEGFFPTLLDVRVLGMLPISRRRLFAAKVIAALLFLGAYLVGADLPAAIFLPGMANSQHVTRHIAAHLLAVGMAGWFAATLALAAMSVAGMVAGRAGRWIAGLLQGAMLGALLLLLFLAPLLGPLMKLVADGHGSGLLWLPPLWFTGVYEVVRGGATESVRFLPAARLAVVATAASTAALLVAYPLAYRRRVRELLEGEGMLRVSRPARLWLPAFFVRGYLPLPQQRAGFELVAKTIFRVRRFRVWLILAVCAGLALAAIAVAKVRVANAAPYLRESHAHPGGVAVLLAIFALGAAYLAMSTELEPGAAWLFELSVGGETQAVASGMRRWALLFSYGVMLAAFPWMWMQATTATMRELALMVGAAAMLTELLFYTFREVPFTAERLRRRGTALPLLAFVCVILPLAFLEIVRCETSVAGSWMAAAVWVYFALGLVWLSRWSRNAGLWEPYLGTEEDAFQRLGL